MIKGKSIVELATEIDRRANAKVDYVADTREMLLEDDGKELKVGGEHDYPLTDLAHRQIGSHVGIPAQYYDRLRSSAPQLLAENVNHWLHEQPSRRMVRTLDGNARAFLSDRYRRIENEDVAQSVLPILMESKDIQILSAEITDRRMYMQAVFPKLEGEVRKGDIVQAGIVISNSEIGLGSFSVSPLLYQLWCTNGAISEHALKRYHVGRRAETIDGSYEVFSDETLAADDHALMLKVQDVVRSSMNQAAFQFQLNKLKEATETDPLKDPIKGVEVLAKKVGLSENESNSVLQNLLRGHANVVDYTKYGLMQAVTAVANEHESYDRAIELEQLGGKILNLPATEWKTLSRAAA